MQDFFRGKMRPRLLFLAALLLAVSAAHWIVPVGNPFLSGLHIAMRKLFVVPIVLSAIWFGMRGAVGGVTVATLLYLPHVFLHWRGNLGQNLNQIGEVVSLWVVALLAGILLQRERRAWKQVARFGESTLTALIKALDARERETERHSVRVRAYALRIGREMGLSSARLRLLSRAALLHDVGKIGIPDRVLLKPGPLDPEEKRLIREHPRIGYKILHPVPFLEKAAEAVLAHHENYDGTGYPNGLRSEQIPLPARVFAVADTFDALVWGRPYQAPIAPETARKKIDAERGKRFDPRVVDAFLEVPIREWAEIAKGLDSA
jgi:putative nucleotidyltransferase with HDIG domain